jgi:7-keto-8-aminopelargonate synthetase-like enzyme
MDDLERQLQSSTPTAPSPLVVVEGLYSMDGDDPPLSEILALCEQYGAWLLIDDAHATGTRGIGGRGSLRTRDLDITARPIVIMGTLSKALGSQGGFVAGPRAVIEWMTNVSRAYLFDTGLAPASAGAALAACKILAEEPHRVDGLREEGARWASEIQALLRTQSQPELISLLGSQVRGPIFPLVTGSAERTLSLRNHLLVRGFQTAAIRPPTVRPGSSRIRLAVCAYHPPEVRDQFIQALAEWMDSGPSEET